MAGCAFCQKSKSQPLLTATLYLFLSFGGREDGEYSPVGKVSCFVCARGPTYTGRGGKDVTSLLSFAAWGKREHRGGSFLLIPFLAHCTETRWHWTRRSSVFVLDSLGRTGVQMSVDEEEAG